MKYILITLLCYYSPIIYAGGADVFSNGDGQIITLFRKAFADPHPKKNPSTDVTNKPIITHKDEIPKNITGNNEPLNKLQK